MFYVLLLIFAVIWFIFKRRTANKEQPLKYPLFLFCLAIIASFILSPNKLNSSAELCKYAGGLLLFFAATSLGYEDKMRVVRAIIFAGFLISLLAIYQYFIGFQHLVNYIAKERINDAFILEYVQAKRIFIPFVTPNTLAGFLAMIIPLTLINKSRVWFIIPVFSALLLTKSLGGLLSACFALGLYFYSQGKLEKSKIALILGLFAVTGLIFVLRSSGQKQHLQPLFSTMMRINYWKETIAIIKEHPLMGVGLGNFDLTQSRFTHNSYLQLYAEMGLLALISFAWIAFRAIREGMRKIRTLPGQSHIAACLLAASVAFLIHNLIDFSFFLPEVSLIWWTILGVIAAL